MAEIAFSTKPEYNILFVNKCLKGWAHVPTNYFYVTDTFSVGIKSERFLDGHVVIQQKVAVDL